MELILVRHGLPVRADAEPGSGLAPDPDLSPTGLEQARLVGDWLAAEPISAIYSSPMRRAFQTAQPLATLTGLPIQVDPDLQEIHFGETSYVPIEEIQSDDPLAAWWRDQVGDHDGEVVTGFRRRVAAAVAGIIDRHAGQTVVITCHGGVVNAALAELLGVRETFIFEIDYTSVSRILASRTGVKRICSVNERGHLRVGPLRADASPG
jgi:broad specificity phosphatase PhoE